MSIRSSFRSFVLLVLVLVAAAPSDGAVDTLSYDISGYIDSNDFLHIKGPTLQWHHVDTGGAAVGRHNGNNFPTVIATALNGVPQMATTNWTPTWPQPVPNEIRFDAFSSIFDSLAPSLPGADVISVEASVISGRGSLTVTQLPSVANDHTLIVRFSDGFTGPAHLRGMITVTTPEPGTSAVLLSLLSAVTVRRRRCPPPA